MKLWFHYFIQYKLFFLYNSNIFFNIIIFQFYQKNLCLKGETFIHKLYKLHVEIFYT